MLSGCLRWCQWYGACLGGGGGAFAVSGVRPHLARPAPENREKIEIKNLLYYSSQKTDLLTRIWTNKTAKKPLWTIRYQFLRNRRRKKEIWFTKKTHKKFTMNPMVPTMTTCFRPPFPLEGMNHRKKGGNWKLSEIKFCELDALVFDINPDPNISADFTVNFFKNKSILPLTTYLILCYLTIFCI